MGPVDAAAAGEAANGRRAAPARSLSGEKAQRIIDAMRRSVARRGTAGSTFDHVSREAGVSRGLLHYYFGSKEQLLAEAVRRDCELRMERLRGHLARARSADDFIDYAVASLQETIRSDPDFVSLAFELFTLSRRNPEIAVVYEDLVRSTREHLAELLAAAESDGVIKLRVAPDAAAELLFALADGFALRFTSEPGRDFAGTVAAGRSCARALFEG